jgi:hypothetical protein
MRTSWSGRVLAETALPIECAAEDGDSSQTCSVIVQAGQGDYVITAEATRAELCEPGYWCPEIGACDAARLDEHGACVIAENYFELPVDVTAETKWNGSCAHIEIVFEDL